MSKTFQPPTRMDQNSWNVAGMQLEVLERSWNIQEWTKNFHSNCIPVHSSSSVIGVLECTSNALRVQLDCCTNIAPNPRSTLLECNSCNLAGFYVGVAKNAIGTFQMLLECHTNVWNAVGMKLECSWNTFPLGMQLESFEHEQNIPTAYKNGPE